MDRKSSDVDTRAQLQVKRALGGIAAATMSCLALAVPGSEIWVRNDLSGRGRLAICLGAWAVTAILAWGFRLHKAAFGAALASIYLCFTVGVLGGGIVSTG